MSRDAKAGHVHRPIPIRQNAPPANRGELFKHTLDGGAIGAGWEGHAVARGVRETVRPLLGTLYALSAVKVKAHRRPTT
jgi:hypothetical protein